MGGGEQSLPPRGTKKQIAQRITLTFNEIHMLYPPSIFIDAVNSSPEIPNMYNLINSIRSIPDIENLIRHTVLEGVINMGAIFDHPDCFC